MKRRSETQLRVGFARLDITPADSLHVKAVAFRENNAAAILLALDFLFVSREWTQRLRDAVSQATGVPPQNILAAATHTHSGPAVFSPIIGKAQILIRETG